MPKRIDLTTGRVLEESVAPGTPLKSTRTEAVFDPSVHAYDPGIKRLRPLTLAEQVEALRKRVEILEARNAR